MKTLLDLRLLILAAIVGPSPALGQTAVVVPERTPLVLRSPVQDKNFYLLSLIERDTRVSEALMRSEPLRKLREAKVDALKQAFEKSLGGDAREIANLMFSEEEIRQVGAVLTDLYRTQPAVRRLTDEPLRRCGLYRKHDDGNGATFLAAAWGDCARGINNLISVYGLGNNGRSPQIDSISYDAKSFLYGALLHNILGAEQETLPKRPLFFQAVLGFGLALLDANRRDEAGRFEPLEKGENRAAFRRAATLDWSKYPYTVIVVPGYGPEEPGVRLSPIAKLALTLAVRRFREGKAPFLLVSGGYVHPKQTPYCEAYEMKQALLKDFSIPENAILIDPHARHTTTNLRNAARLMYRYGFPFDRPGLITTNTYQSADIAGEGFFRRCQNIFGYQPHKTLKRLSPFDLEFLPQIDSLYADPIDPLDP
ncbi:MAG: YdcF family protein [Capsulimonadales bacterium]|nr:YdcF family protein [Capsulimonadales bacterium]